MMPAEPDVAGARRLLEEAGLDIPDTKIRLEVSVPDGDATQVSYGKLLADQIRDGLGIEVKYEPLGWQYYQPNLAEGSFSLVGMFRLSWSTNATAPAPTYNDPAQFLSAMFGERGESMGNVAAWSDLTLDQTLEDLDGTDDLGQRNVLVGQAVQRLCEQMPYVPTVFTTPLWRVRSSAIGSALGDLKTGPDGQLLLRELYAQQ